MHHQPRRTTAIGRRCWQRLAQVTRGALAAAAVQVEHPAGDEEQAHAQAAEHHHYAPGHAEVAARVQREHAGGQLRAGALARIGAGIEHGPRAWVQLQQIMRAVMLAAALRRITGHHPHVQCLPRLLRQAQVDVAGAHAGQCVQRGFDAFQVQGGVGGDLVPGGRCDAQQGVGGTAIPVERPPQAGQRTHQVDQQHPGADHRVQAPQEATAAAFPFHRQPAAPVPPAPRPAQVEPGQGEEQQRDGTTAGDPFAALAGGEVAVQVFDEVEERLPTQGTEALTAVRVEVHPVFLAAGKARHRRPLSGGIHAQALQGAITAGLQQRHQFAEFKRKLAVGMVLGDLGEAGIGRPQQFILEGQHGAAEAHHGQHGTGGDAQQPVQLEQDVLEHRRRRAWKAAARILRNSK